MINPALIKPHRAPKASVIAIANGKGRPAWNNTPSAMAHRPMVEPNEISMPPLTITMVNGSATMPIQIKSLVLNNRTLMSSMRGLTTPNARISISSRAASASSQPKRRHCAIMRSPVFFPVQGVGWS
ncbi:Uncharacterised protein [Serratia fonticola]|uniref:Uncharacterized protein n=1 Tax=Serratia fonticola TaxID=47917 RepID=A0A4U9TI33_SERFO|nr:Uncharacterised protein [Serratia fonticola]